jgi:phosphatidylinositol glycan class F
MKTNATTSSVNASAEPEAEVSASSPSVSAAEALSVHLISGLGLGLAVLLAHNVYSVNLVSHPSLTLCLIWVNHSFSFF